MPSASHEPPNARKLLSPVAMQGRFLRGRFRSAGLRPGRVILGRGTVSFWTGGSGPPLLMLPGFGATAVWQWHPQIKALSRRHRLIIPDLLFFGDSTSRRTERSLEAQADTMCQLLDHLNIDKAHVMGLSYGGFVAYLLATRWPERVARLVLNNSPGPVMGRAEVDDMLKRYRVDRVHDIFLPGESEGIRRLLEIGWYRAPGVPRWILSDAHQLLFRDQLEAKHALLSQLLSLVENSDALEAPVHSPTLILWGAHDPVFPLHLAHRLLRHVGDSARLSVVDKAAHAPNLERPRVFNRLVLDFLAK